MNKKRINPTRSEGQDGSDFERLLADVRGHIWEFQNLGKLAKKADLNVATVSDLAHGQTRSPHIRTVLRIMVALGKSDSILQAFAAERPVTTKMVARRWINRQKRLQAQRAGFQLVRPSARERRQSRTPQ